MHRKFKELLHQYKLEVFHLEHDKSDAEALAREAMDLCEEALHQKYASEGLVIVGVNIDRNSKKMKNFLKRFPVTFRIVRGDKVLYSYDFDNDGRADILLRHGVTGDVFLWLMDGASVLAEVPVGRDMVSRPSSRAVPRRRCARPLPNAWASNRVPCP